MHKCRPSRILPLLWPLLLTTPARSERVNYSPDINGLSIGKGVAGLAYSQPLPSCVSGPIHQIPASGATLHVSIVRNADDLNEALHLETRAKASFLDIVGGSGHFDADQQFDQKNIAFDVVIEASEVLPSDSFSQSPTWLPQFQSLLDAHQLQQIRDACGDRYVSTVYNGARVFAIVRVRTSAKDFHLNVNQGGQAQFDIGIVNASAFLGTDTDIRTAHQSGSIDVVATSEGAGGFSSLSNLIGVDPSDDLKGIANKVMTAMTHIQPTGEAVAYELTDYPGFPPRSFSDLIVDGDLVQLSKFFRATRQMYENVDCLINNCDGRGHELTPIEFKQVTDFGTALKQTLMTTADRYAKCARAYDSALFECSANLPPPPPPPDTPLLPPALMPNFGGLVLLVDGDKVLNPAQTFVAMAAGQSLLDGVHAVYPAAREATLFLLIDSPYFSTGSFALAGPAGSPPTFVTFGSDRPSGHFASSWRLPFGMAESTRPVIIAHADAGRPCSRLVVPASGAVRSSVVGFADSCLSPEMQTLRAELYRSVEQEAKNGCVSTGGATDTEMPLLTWLSDRFGHAFLAKFGSYWSHYSASGGTCNIALGIFVTDERNGTSYAFAAAGGSVRPGS